MAKKKTSSKKNVVDQTRSVLSNLADRVQESFEDDGSDIIDLILEHHKPLKQLIKTMKSEDATYTQKKKAFKEFAPTLIAHAKPEEKAWYKDLKSECDMNVEGIEGDVEHGIADRLCKEISRTSQKDIFLAKVKVLAEVVEHHIKEEEEDLLPEYKRNSDADERKRVGKRYLSLREKYL